MESQGLPLNIDQVWVFLACALVLSSAATREAKSRQPVSRRLLFLYLVFSLDCPARALFINVLEGGSHLLELFKWSEHQLLVVKHADCVIGLHGYLDRSKGRVYR